jgi:hypothetical protein
VSPRLGLRHNTLGFVQGVEAKLDEHKRIATMFKHVIEYNVHMTNILLKLSNLKIKNKHIIKNIYIFIQNLQGVLEKKQKLKA